jgi:small subunit ribosomal protein S21
LTVVRIHEDEPFEIALKKFKRKCIRDGIFSEVRKRRHYEKPSIKKRRKIESARREALKKGALKGR